MDIAIVETGLVSDEEVSIDALFPDPSNTNIHPEETIDTLRAIYRRFGQRKSIAVHRQSRTIIAGNGFYQAMKLEGAEKIKVTWYDGPEEEARAYAQADNQVAMLSHRDDSLVGAVLRELQDNNTPIDDLGYSSSQLEGLLGQAVFDNSLSLAFGQSPKPQTSEIRTMGDKRKIIKPVLYAEQIEVFEQALRETGERNRGLALINICRFYLDNHAERQRAISEESLNQALGAS